MAADFVNVWGERCSGGLLLALAWTLRKTPHFFVGIIGQAKQAYPGEKYRQPAHAENDPEQHYAIRFNPLLRGWT
jgi:hypothetical protein